MKPPACRKSRTIFRPPIGQYGELAESYHQSKPIHFFLNDFGTRLAPMMTVLPAAAKLRPGDVDQPRFAVRTSGDSGFVFLHNFQDHVPTHDLENVQLAIQTNAGEVRIPQSSSMTVKSEVSAILPFNVDFGGVRMKSATAQPMARLAGGGGARTRSLRLRAYSRNS